MKRGQLEVRIDQKSYFMSLDTGSASTSLARLDGHKVVGYKNYLDFWGNPYKCKIIQAQKTSLGPQNFSNPLLEVCSKKHLGLDLLKEVVLEVHPSGNKAFLLEAMPGLSIFQTSLHKTSNGLYTLKINVNGKHLNALLDTGMKKSLIDMSFIKQHASSFPKRSEIKGRIFYNLDQVQIDSLQIKNQKIESLYFSKSFKKTNGQAQFILGQDLFDQGLWVLDFKNQKIIAK